MDLGSVPSVSGGGYQELYQEGGDENGREVSISLSSIGTHGSDMPYHAMSESSSNQESSSDDETEGVSQQPQEFNWQSELSLGGFAGTLLAPFAVLLKRMQTSSGFAWGVRSAYITEGIGSGILLEYFSENDNNILLPIALVTYYGSAALIDILAVLNRCSNEQEESEEG